MPDTGVLRPARLLETGPVPAPGLQVDLFRPLDIAAVGDSIYVVDNGNDHVVVLSRSLLVLGVLGREGGAPGEFRQPAAVRAGPAGVVILDMGNSRFTGMDRAGNVVRTSAAPPGLRSFAVTRGGDAVVPARDGIHHFVRIAADGTEQGFGRWPGHRTAPPAGDDLATMKAGLLDPAVAVTAGDTVHVLDEETAVLYKYSPSGTLLLQRAVPRSYHDSVVTARDALTDRLRKRGFNVLPSPLSRGLSTMPDGRLLLVLPAGETFGFLIDPGSYSARRVVLPADSAARDLFRGARAATVVDSVLYLLRDAAIHAFRVRPAS